MKVGVILATFLALGTVLVATGAAAQGGSEASPTAPSDPAASDATATPAKSEQANEVGGDSPEQAAEALILEGVELRKTGRDQEALKRFERAHDLHATPRALAQRALAEQALGRWVSAEVHLEAALSSADDAWITANREALQAALQRIRAQLSSLNVLGGVEGAEVRINGVVVGTLPLPEPLRLPAGRVTLEVVHKNYYPVSRPLNLMGDGTAVETISMTPRPADTAAQPGKPSPAAGQPVGIDPGPTPQTAGLPPAVFWIAAGATVVLSGVGTWSAFDTLDANDRYETYANEDPNAVRDEGKQHYDEAKSRQDRTNWLLGASALGAVATGVIAIFTDWGGSETTASEPTGQSAKRLSPNLVASPRGMALSLGGRF